MVDNLEPGVYQESYSIYKSYQMRVHGDPPEECDENGFSRFLIQTSLVVRGFWDRRICMVLAWNIDLFWDADRNGREVSRDKVIGKLGTYW